MPRRRLWPSYSGRSLPCPTQHQTRPREPTSTEASHRRGRKPAIASALALAVRCARCPAFLPIKWPRSSAGHFSYAVPVGFCLIIQTIAITERTSSSARRFASSSRTGHPRFAGDRSASWSARNSGGLHLDQRLLSAHASAISSRHGSRCGVWSGSAELRARLPPPAYAVWAYFPVSPNASNAEPTKRRTPPAPQIMYAPIMPSKAPSKTSAMAAHETKKSSSPSIRSAPFSPRQVSPRSPCVPRRSAGRSPVGPRRHIGFRLHSNGVGRSITTNVAAKAAAKTEAAPIIETQSVVIRYLGVAHTRCIARRHRPTMPTCGAGTFETDRQSAFGSWRRCRPFCNFISAAASSLAAPLRAYLRPADSSLGPPLLRCGSRWRTRVARHHRAALPA